MYEFKPSADLLPVMPGDRLYSVSNYTIEDDEYYAEGVVVTEDSLQVVLNGEVYDLGDGLFPSREEALDWIEKNRRPTILESLICGTSSVSVLSAPPSPVSELQLLHLLSRI